MKTGNKCCICHQEFNHKLTRLVLQKFDNKKTYGQYHNTANYDFCDNCFKIFNKWLGKHKE